MNKSICFYAENDKKIDALKKKFKCNQNKMVNLLVSVGYEHLKDKTLNEFYQLLVR